MKRLKIIPNISQEHPNFLLTYCTYPRGDEAPISFFHHLILSSVSARLTISRKFPKAVPRMLHTKPVDSLSKQCDRAYSYIARALIQVQLIDDAISAFDV